MARAALLAVALQWGHTLADDGSASWMTDHHDQRNSGFAAGMASPASGAAACRRNLYDAPMKGVRFQGTGVWRWTAPATSCTWWTLQR